MTDRLTDPEDLKELLGIPFTAEQMACITAPLAPNVIVAGAGSGKTTVMAARVVWLVGTGQVTPERVLGLTFTNKAAAELAERVRKALVRAGVTDPDPADPDQAPGEPRICTYHAFAGQLLADHGLRIGLEPGVRLLADATRYQLAARVLRTAPGPYPALTRSLSTLAADLIALDAELCEHLVDVDRLRAHDAELAERLAALDPAARGFAWVRETAPAVQARTDLTGLVAAYREQKRSRDLLDFGDQIALAAALARTRPEVGRMLREEFAVVLLDEYQDTSVAQRVMLSCLFGSGTGHPVTAVGDPCQAIYGWRGASVANLDDFPAHFPHRDGTPAHRRSLSENRRSGGRLLAFANRLAAPLRERHEGVEELRPAPGAERDGTVRCALLPTQDDETAWLADRIRHLTDTGTPPGEIAVLCRTAGQFADIHAALVARDVPVEVVGLSGLLHLPEIADLVATCDVLYDPTANAALVRLLTGPRWRIGPRDLALLGRRARLLVRQGPAGHGPDGAPQPDRLALAVEGADPAEVVSLADALETFLGPDGPDDGLPFSPEARVRFARLAAELRDLRRSLSDPLMDLLHRVLAVTGLEVELSASPSALAARRRETLQAFLDIAAGFAPPDGQVTLPAFLAFLRTAEQYEKGLDSSLPGGENTVKVMTAHKSKGLEWDVVAVPGLVQGAFPSAKVRELWPWHGKVLPHALRGDAATLPDVAEWTKKGLDAFKERMKEHNALEELRLGYVTFTRPRSLLLASGHWWGPSQKTRRGPSQFLHRLREHCEAGHGEIEHWAEEPADGAENPALARTADHPWPLPLDPAALEARRQAARTVLSLLEAAPAPEPDGHGHPDPEPYPPEEDPREHDPDWDLLDDWEDLPTVRPQDLPPIRAEDVPAARAEDVPAARAEDVPAARAEDVPAARAEDLPTVRPRDLPPIRAGDVPAACAEDVPAARAEDVPAARAEDVLAARAEDVPAARAEDVPPARAEDVPPARAEHLPPAHAEHLPPARPAAPPAIPAQPTARDHPEAAQPLTPEETRLVASWDRDLDALADELRRARETVRDVPLPMSLSASQLMRLAADPDAFARDLARPMPRPPQPAARRGTRFHAWVESRFDELPLIGLDELPGMEPEAPEEIADERDLETLKEAFLRTPYAHRTPYRVEAPFQLPLAGRVVRGRIDAVYRNADGTFEIVDWKTGRTTDADALQLAVYRLAWAEQHGLPLDRVSAAFVHVRTGRTLRPAGLPDRAALERLLLGDPGHPYHPAEHAEAPSPGPPAPRADGGRTGGGPRPTPPG